MNIQWYPGHMTKTRRQMERDLHEVDAVIELCDARIARSSRNPDLAELRGDKPTLLVFGRSDLADPACTARWRQAIPDSVDCILIKPGADKIIVPAIQKLLAEKLRKYAERGQHGRALRLMVTGVPNVGKSTLINALSKKKAAKAEDRPGVTRARQWFPVGQGLLLMDTPGMLWPKFEDPEVGMFLAFTGAVRDEIIDIETLCMHLCQCLRDRAPEALTGRYGISLENTSEDGVEGGGVLMMEAIARRRGFLVSGGECDYERTARTVLDEFRAGKLGRISLEEPDLLK